MAKILVVDAQPCVRELLYEELILDGHEVHTVGDAQAAREHLVFFLPHLVLLDPYPDSAQGFGLLENIKHQHPDLPIIIVTACEACTEDPRLSRADGCLIKGIYFWDELRQEIADFLRQKRTPREFDARANPFQVSEVKPC